MRGTPVYLVCLNFQAHIFFRVRIVLLSCKPKCLFWLMIPSINSHLLQMIFVMKQKPSNGSSLDQIVLILIHTQWTSHFICNSVGSFLFLFSYEKNSFLTEVSQSIYNMLRLSSVMTLTRHHLTPFDTDKYFNLIFSPF